MGATTKQNQLEKDRNKDDMMGAVCYAVGKGVGAIPLVGWLADAATSMVCSHREANEKYKKFLPVLRALIKTEGRDSKDAINMLEEIANLAPFGAQRLNFRTCYVDDPNGWKKLPDDPEKLPYGFWW